MAKAALFIELNTFYFGGFMDDKPIYEIHVYDQEWKIDSSGWLECGFDECVGFYYEKETAIKAIEENWCNIQDHFAHSALIVEKVPGLYPHPPRSKCIYYIWNQDKNCFEKSAIPESSMWIVP